MARPLRIEFPGAWYHIMNRGRRREDIFQDQKDYQAFLDLLASTSRMFRVGIAAYCLMPNHYHLLIHTPEGNCSRAMRHLAGVYTQMFNRRHSVDGQLFRGRYKAILVDENEYLLGLLRYIHHNPLKAGLVEKLDAYPWTSHHGYIAGAVDWLHKGPVLSQFSDHPALAKKAYLQYMAKGDSDEIEKIFSLMKLPAVLGSLEFVRKIKDRFFDKKKNSEVPEAKVLAPTAQEIKLAVCAAYGIGEKELLTSRRGNTNEPRNVAIYLTRTLRGENLQEIAGMYGIATYSTVSSTLGRVQQQLDQDSDFKKRLQELTSSLNMNKGQRQT